MLGQGLEVQEVADPCPQPVGWVKCGPGHNGTHPWGPGWASSCCLWEQSVTTSTGLKPCRRSTNQTDRYYSGALPAFPILQGVFLIFNFIFYTSQPRRINLYFSSLGKKTKRRPKRDQGL